MVAPSTFILLLIIRKTKERRRKTDLLIRRLAHSGFRDNVVVAALARRGFGDALQGRLPVPASTTPSRLRAAGAPVPVLLTPLGVRDLVGGALLRPVAAPELVVLLLDGLAPPHLLVLPRS